MMKLKILMCIFIFLFSISCSEKQPTYEEQFELNRFKMRQYDLYNPILNTFKLDSTARKAHSDNYDFDAYYDDSDTLRYLFYRSESYGYLEEFLYEEDGRLRRVFIYSILSSWLDKGANIIFSDYYYWNGKLKIIRDDLNETFLIINEDTVTIYDGVLESRDEFKIEQKKISDYYIRFLN